MIIGFSLQKTKNIKRCNTLVKNILSFGQIIRKEGELCLEHDRDKPHTKGTALTFGY